MTTHSGNQRYRNSIRSGIISTWLASGCLALSKGEGEGCSGRLPAIHLPRRLVSAARPQCCLSLSQRERTEVRDHSRHASRALTISPLERYPILDESDDSRIAAPRFRDEREILLAHDRVSIRPGSYDRRHPARSPALQQGSRSRVCKARADAADEICNLQNSDSAGGARACVPTSLDACADNERDSQNHLTCSAFIAEGESTPHLSPLPLSKGRGDTNCTAFVVQSHESSPR
jgi:hypothetical protein